MTTLCFLLLLAQVHTLDRSRLSEFQKAQIRDAADTYWREVEGSNYWLAPLVSWEMGHRDRRPLTNWTRIVGTAHRDGKNLIVIQELGRQPSHLVLTNLPSAKI